MVASDARNYFPSMEILETKVHTEEPSNVMKSQGALITQAMWATWTLLH